MGCVHDKRRWASLLMSVILILGLFGARPAYADNNQRNSERYEATEYLIKRGILPQDAKAAHILSAEQFMYSIKKAYLKAEGAMDPNWLEDNHIVTRSERERLSDGDVNWIMLWRITLCLSGNWPMPNEYFPDIKHPKEVEDSYADARATAIAMGLADGKEPAICRLLVGDYAVYFKKLLTGDYEPLKFGYEDLPGADLIDFDRSVLDPALNRAWNGYFRAYQYIPDEYIDAFRAKGWSVIFGRDFSASKQVEGGLCSWARKEIWLNITSDKGAYHEFGHFVMRNEGYDDEAKRVFAKEGPNMKDYLGDYSQTNYAEYFAVCTAAWFQDSDYEKFKAEAPLTYELMDKAYGRSVEIQPDKTPLARLPFVFDDVFVGDWFFGSVKYAVKNGLMSGTGGGKFDPDGDLDGAMMSMILCRAAGEDTIPSDGVWYSAAVAWAEEALDGVIDEDFDPCAPLTRGQLAGFLFAYENKDDDDEKPLNETISLDDFRDFSKIDAGDMAALEWAVQSGVIQGTDGGLLKPDAPVKRCEAAAMLERYFNNAA